MAVVDGSIQLGHQLAAWFTTNAALVLLDGQIVYCKDGANAGKYKIGDGTTALSALTFYGGVSASGLTVGTTTITGGTNTKVLYNNNGVVGEYTVNGTGNVVLSSELSNYLTTAAAALSYQPLDADLTSWAGVTRSAGFDTFVTTPSSANLASLVTDETGSGSLVFGTSPTFTTSLLMNGAGGASVSMNDIGSGYGALHISSTPSGSNFALASDGSTILIVNAPQATSDVYIGAGNNGNLILTGNRTSGVESSFYYTPTSKTGTTAGANAPIVDFVLGTRTWATGAISANYGYRINAPTFAAAAASTMTLGATLYVNKPVAGTNMTISSNYAIYSDGDIAINGTNGVVQQNYGNIFYRIATCRISSNFSANGDLGLYGNAVVGISINSVETARFTSTSLTFADSKNIIFNTGTGTKLGTATTQKLAFWNATPIVQPTTAVTAATIVGGAGTTVKEDHTFDGYTIGQVVKALRNAGLLA